MDLLNTAVAAFAHRAIAERNRDLLASEALAYLTAALEAERAELFVVSADGTSLDVVQRFPAARGVAPQSIPARGESIAAEAYARAGVVVRDGHAATAVECDGGICVFAVYARRPLVLEAVRNALDAIAAMYAAAVARGDAEEQLADREERLRLILDQIPAVVSTLDTDLVFTSTQGRGMAAVSAESARIVGRTLMDVIHEDEASAPIMAARKALDGVPTQYEYTWEGRAYENRMEPLRNARGDIVGIVNLGLDVTEARKAAAALRASREEVRRMSVAMNEIQENERRRIAREVHDDLGQRLTALQLDLGLLRNDVRGGRSAAAEERVAAMLVQVDETLETARRVATELRPAILDEFGFAAALRNEVESFARRSGIDVTLDVAPPDIAVESARATALYRVIQEALTNVARHAGATRVDVRVEQRGGRIETEVRDDGRGITDAELANGAALGLISIRERVFAFDGEVVIERVESGGTRVFVSVPFSG
jgi:signal transduction histidine kinase